MATRYTVPAPPGLPVVGHLHQIARSGLVGHLLNVSRDMPEGIFKLRFGSRVSLFVTDPDLVAELSDETRFRKMPGPGLRVVRKFAGDGLFTAFSEEPNWGKAHRILLPAFSNRAMRGYFDMIVEVCDQLVAKWERAAGTDVHVADDMTRLTLDSIAIAGFGHRFNSFEREELDSFLLALGRALSEALSTITRLPIQQRFARKAVAQYEADIAEMNALVDGIIAERRAAPGEGRDLLNLMLTAVDPETGEGLDDLNIRYQVLTFLIAGHETTSGMLTFAFAYLLRNPAVLAQAYAEVDRVLPGDTRPDYAQVAKLEVIERILKEALRLWPTAPSFSVAPFEDQVIGGRYVMRRDRPINVFTPGVHRFPSVWSDPDEFDIDRWLPHAEAERHPHAYKPFGNGERACIGRQFAMVEAKIAMAMLLRRFAISDPHSYKLRIKETLSIKPDDFSMRIRLRQPHERLSVRQEDHATEQAVVAAVAGSGQQFAVLYGSSLGTARDIAEEIADRARADGFDVVVRSMDESFKGGAAPQDKVIVLVTATYNGRAPDSATAVERALDAGAFDDADWSGARVAVLGIGNSQWPNYQSFPKRVAAAVERAGATLLVPRAEADGQGDFDGAVAAFVRALWTALGAAAEPAAKAALTLTPIDAAATRALALPEHAQRLEIVANDELVRPADGLWNFEKEPPRPSTRLIRVRLPEGQAYHTGDHVAVYARNRPDLVDRAVERLGVDAAAQVRVEAQGGRFRHLPVGQTVTVRQLLTDFVELSDAAPRRAVAHLAAHTRCPHTREGLAVIEADYDARVAAKRTSLLDLLDAHPAAELSLDAFVDLSPAIAPRFYSIASSPLVSADVADLIVGTMAAPAWSGLGEHRGFASGYMQGVASGDHVFGYVRRPNPPFAPPADASVPMILIGPGTGFAPLRGFLQERSAQAAAGQEVARNLLFFGCRHPDHDWFCREEMERWQADGIVDLHLAFSAVETHPWRFVQDALFAQQEAVWRALQAGASIYLCGDGKFMAPAVRDTLIRTQMQQVGDEHAQGSAWLERMIADGRFHQDVFGFGK
ncbi:bifunctional cytochrome P450/NADPH--P450 reductase [Sphingomonas corticis]|jgi:cytochrome P450/NADPH-cytochrome P450 reductase|uniref:Bifunctional cytochrome P450/NADPH--P450 reductase n=1 Tax=Sphingomonas corticis TaxID=2722791 RepID=A0ABX1CM23_9SPHN|nr:cytochrome P450 [Sphingomonas corticis]NJR79035.1 cytochrome P450 [Sphingomonas corticis]